MSSSRNALVACGLAALALVAPAGLACTGAQAQSSIKIVVNGDPITTNEINQRARFLRLVARDLAGPQLVRQATDELVEERIKFQEAKRLKITANEAQVELAFGGIAQRVKLASELAKRSTGHTIYILDEPTTGLHFEDIRKLLTVLSRLVDQGNTVLVIEHNLDVIKTADWIVDLGPEGGKGGGTVVVEGPPELVAETPESYTGQFLAPLLERG